MNESILSTIKKLCHIDAEDPSFDQDIALHINTAIFELEQVGVAHQTGFIVFDKTQSWTDYLGDRTDIEAVKSCIYMKVRLLFDPPTNSFLVESMNKQIEQLMWRIREQTANVEV